MTALIVGIIAAVVVAMVVLACGGYFVLRSMQNALHESSQTASNGKKPTTKLPAKQQPKPPNENELLAAKLRDVQSGNSRIATAAAKWLAKAKFRPEKQTEVARALDKALTSKNPFVRKAALSAAAVWADAKSITVLTQFAQRNSISANTALKVILRFQDSDRDKVIAALRLLADGNNPRLARSATTALMKMVWDVHPDPLPADRAIDQLLKPDVVLETRKDGRVIFPTRRSPFVALEPKGTENVIQVYDLRIMQRVGQPIENNFSKFVYQGLKLSPDGAYLAALGKGKGIEIWSVKTGSLVRSIGLGEKGQVSLCDFAGKHQLITYRYPYKNFFIWDIPSGEEVSQIPLYSDGFDPRYGQLSPNAKYLIWWDVDTTRGRHLQFYETATGRLVGEVETFYSTGCSGIAVTPDGERVAMLWTVLGHPKHCRLQCWEVRTGKQLCDHKLTDPVFANKLPVGGLRAIQWLPDGRGWLLYGHVVVDFHGGNVLGKLPLPKGWRTFVTRPVLDSNHLVMRQDNRLLIEALPPTSGDASDGR